MRTIACFSTQSLVLAELNRFVALFFRTIYAIKMKLLCLSFQPGSLHSLESFIVWTADTTKMRFQIKTDNSHQE